MKKAKRKKSKTTKAIRSAKSAARKTGAGLFDALQCCCCPHQRQPPGTSHAVARE